MCLKGVFKIGAWGEKPFENDSALDWMGSVDVFLTQKIHDGLVDEDYFHKRAAAELLIDSINRDLVADYNNLKNLRLAIAELNIVKDDANWISSWSRPTYFYYDIERQIGVLISQLEDLEDSWFVNE